MSMDITRNLLIILRMRKKIKILTLILFNQNIKASLKYDNYNAQLQLHCNLAKHISHNYNNRNSLRVTATDKYKYQTQNANMFQI